MNWNPLLFPRKIKYFFYNGSILILAKFGLLKKVDLLKYPVGYLLGDLLGLAKKFIERTIKTLGEPTPSEIKIIPVEHHLAYVALAYYFSGFDRATVITLDGAGEYESTVIWKVKRRRI